jgi:hypothetical protein
MNSPSGGQAKCMERPSGLQQGFTGCQIGSRRVNWLLVDGKSDMELHPVGCTSLKDLSYRVLAYIGSEPRSSLLTDTLDKDLKLTPRNVHVFDRGARSSLRCPDKNAIQILISWRFEMYVSYLFE